ncbi:uncharacterized protein [Rhodnius prolixus]|uniref:RING-type domain-containing protein n=1 Tax=Rhodnius prolixus TaxID=13249 RepID=A0A4P6D7Y6_RHOPR
MILYVRAAALAVTVVVAVSTYLWTRAHSNRAHRERPLNVAPSQNDPRAEQSGNFSSLNPIGSQNIRNCLVCDESLDSDEQSYTLEACRHTFHLVCLQSYQLARSLENENGFVCPVTSCRTTFAQQ